MAGEWKAVPLEEVYEFSSGLSKQRSAFGSGYPFLGFRDVFYNSAIPAQLAELVNSTAQERTRCSIKRGDVFVTRTSETMDELGMSCVALRDIPNATFNGFTKRLRPRDSHTVVPEYARYFFRAFGFRSAVTAMSSLSTRASLNNEMLARLHIVLPPRETQWAIGHILGTLDDKIELNRLMSETLEAMARALFKSWFVDFDPVRAKAEGRDPGLPQSLADLFPSRLVDSDVGEIPEGWEVGRVGHLCDVDKGLSYKGEGLAEEGGLPMVNLGCFGQGGVFKAENIKRYDGEFKERHLVNAGDLLVANTDMTQNRIILGSPVLLAELDGERRFLFTHHTFALRFKADADRWRKYLYFTLLQPEFRKVAEGFATGTTVLALPRDALLNLALVLPPDSPLQAFEQQVEALLASADLLRRQVRTLAPVRDALLPKLIAGELRPGPNRQGTHTSANL